MSRALVFYRADWRDMRVALIMRSMIGRQSSGVVATIAILAWMLAAVAFAQSDPRTAMLERAGWDALATNQPRTAAEAFRQALAADPKKATLHLGAGAAAYLERRDADAKAALQRALQLNPKLTQARELLGLVLYRAGDLLGAIRAYEGLSPDVPENHAAMTRLEGWRREFDLHTRMNAVAGNGFTVSFEGPADAELAARALASIERSSQRISAVLFFYPLEPIPVVLYTGEQFRDITRAPQWAAGAYDGIIRVPMRGALENEKELDRVLAHEFTHAVIHRLAPRNVPAWLNEGLATALEREDPGPTEIPAGLRPDAIPLSALRAGFGRFTGAQATLAYATSAMVARRLLDEAGGFAMSNLLRDLGEGVDFDTAFSHRMQRSLEAFEADLAQALLVPGP